MIESQWTACVYRELGCILPRIGSGGPILTLAQVEAEHLMERKEDCLGLRFDRSMISTTLIGQLDDDGRND